MASLDELLARCRARYERLSPAEAFAALEGGALLVDNRPLEQRTADGEVPGAVVVGRNVLEWRFDPAGDWRIPEADPGAVVILLCDEGCSTVLGVARLLDLGYRRASDVEGGFQAWRAAGLPTVPVGTCVDRTPPRHHSAVAEVAEIAAVAEVAAVDLRPR